MKKRRYFYTLFCFLIGLIFIIQSCKKDCQTECEKFTEANADFKMYQEVNFNGDRFEETTFANGDVIFETTDASNDKVFWKIGTDTNTYSGRKLILGFSNISGVLNAECITYKKMPEDCNGSKKEWDTTRRTLTFTPPDKFELWGSFKGSYTNGTGGERVVTLRYLDTSNYQLCAAGREAWGTIMGLHSESTCNDATPNCERPQVSYSNSHFIVTSAGGSVANWNPKYCHSTSGKGYLDPQNMDKIIIDFSWGEGKEFDTHTYKTFVGYRIK